MASATSTAFIGRSRELAALIDAATGAGSNRTTWLIGGEAGVGKTRLVQELARNVDSSDAVVVAGSCIHTAHGSLPFVSVIEALRNLCRAFGPEQIEAAMGTTPELGLLLPDFGDPPLAQSKLAADEGSQLRLFDAVSGLVSRLAESRRVCVVLEDLHWADKSTRDLFVYLVHNLSGTPATLVGTYRSDEMSRTHPLRPVLVELRRSQRVEQITLEPFDDDELAIFATSILDRPPTARMLDEVADRSGGNAFFAAEILDSLLAGRRRVRPELSDLILARIESLSEPTQELLRLVAASGESVRDELLEVVAELSDDELATALREAIEHQVLVLTDDGLLRFRHALMQEAVYATMLPRERQRAHARYAQALVDTPHLAAAKECCDAELAWHLREARDHERALPASVAAARSAAAVLAFAEALGHVEVVLELWAEIETAADLAGMKHVDALRWAAELADTVGDYPRAAQFQRAAITEAAHLPDPEKALLHMRLGRFLQSSGHALQSLAEYERAVAAVPANPPTSERARVLAGYGQQLMLTLRPEARGVLEEAIAVARAVGAPDTEGHALNTLGTILLHDGHHDEGMTLLLEALDIAERADAPDDQLRVFVNLVGGLNEAGDLAAAERLGRAGVERAAELGREQGFGFFIACNLTETLTEMGRWAEAGAVAERVKRPEGDLPERWMLSPRVSRALRQSGVDAARAVLSGTDVDTLGLPDPQLVPAYSVAEAELAMASGDLDACRSAIDQGLESAVLIGQTLTLRAQAIELDLAIASRSADGAEALARAEAELAEMERLAEARVAPGDTKSFRIHAVLAQARAEVAHARGDDPNVLWREAAELWGEGRFVWHRARTLFRLASVLLQQGDRDAAAATLVECADIASEIGAQPLEQAARRLIDHAGLRRDRAEGEADGLLTARELAVLRLVAEGRTNRQIGEELFISPKTASVHVSRILQKLQVENRTEAAAAGREAGLV